jgi:hypothetical protein
MALSDIAIRNAKPKDKPYKMGDTGGLFLLVQPSGGKLWRLKYRIDGKEKKLALGRYPDVGLGAARVKRDEARTLIAAGKDPAIQKAREKAERKVSSDNTFTAARGQGLEASRSEACHGATLRDRRRRILHLSEHVQGARCDGHQGGRRGTPNSTPNCSRTLFPIYPEP